MVWSLLPTLGRRGPIPIVMLASLVFVCACRTPFTSQPPVLAVLPKQPQPPGLPEQSSAPAPGLPQSPLPARLLLGPPRTARHLPGSPLAQCPSPLLLYLRLRFISCAGCPPLPSFYPWGLPPPPPCAPQSPEFARGPSRRQKAPAAAAQTVFANNVTHFVFHHSGMRGCLPPCQSPPPPFLQHLFRFPLSSSSHLSPPSRLSPLCVLDLPHLLPSPSPVGFRVQTLRLSFLVHVLAPPLTSMSLDRGLTSESLSVLLYRTRMGLSGAEEVTYVKCSALGLAPAPT